MEAADIIRENPEWNWRKSRHGNREVLIATDPGRPNEKHMVAWMGEIHVMAKMPLKKGDWSVMIANLRDHQPGKEFETVYDDRLAERLRKSGTRFYRSKNGNVILSIGGAP